MPARPARKKRTQPKATHKLKALREKREARSQKPAPVKDRIYEPHPLAELLPPMSELEFESLLEDIRVNGQRQPIVLFEGKILDGRNRWRAVSKLNGTPKFRQFDPATEGSPISFVVSTANHRNMNDGQKACAATNILPEFEKAAHQRQTLGNPVPQGEAGKARDIVGRLFGVSGRYIQTAKLLKEKSPENFDAAFRAKMPLSKAVRAYQRSLKLADLKKKAKTHAVASVSGDHWKIITGDCVEQLKKLTDRPRLIFADPPYNLGFDYGNGAKADSLPEGKYHDWCWTWLSFLAQILADDGSLFVMIDSSHQDAFKGRLECTESLHFRNTILWHETFGSYTDNNFTSCARFIHYFTKHKSRFVFNGDAIRIPSDRQAKYGDSRADPAGKVPGNVWSEFPRLVDNAAERMPGFPTQVPLALMERIVKVASEPGDLVLDPFNGSGTTGHAALLHGRRYIGIEQVEQNAAFARARLMNVQLEKSSPRSHGGHGEEKSK